MPEPDAGTLPLNKAALRAVKLPIRDLVIYQDPHYQAVSSASVLLVEYVLARCNNEDREVLELGSGCGIVSLMLALQRPNWQVTGWEIAPSQVQLARDNALLCGVQTDFVEADLRTAIHPRPAGLIVSNPPWMPQGSGLRSPFPGRAAGREELLCSMHDVMEAIKRNLHTAGEAVIIYPIQREADLKREVCNSSLDIIELNFSNEPSKYLLATIRHKGS